MRIFVTGCKGQLGQALYAALAEVEGATIGAWEAGAEIRYAVTEMISERAAEIAPLLNH